MSGLRRVGEVPGEAESLDSSDGRRLACQLGDPPPGCSSRMCASVKFSSFRIDAAEATNAQSTFPKSRHDTSNMAPPSHRSIIQVISSTPRTSRDRAVAKRVAVLPAGAMGGGDCGTRRRVWRMRTGDARRRDQVTEPAAPGRAARGRPPGRRGHRSRASSATRRRRVPAPREAQPCAPRSSERRRAPNAAAAVRSCDA
jgi:hypothetical protein